MNKFTPLPGLCFLPGLILIEAIFVTEKIMEIISMFTRESSTSKIKILFHKQDKKRNQVKIKQIVNKKLRPGELAINL
jgi:uncharacterized protein YneF (UPF0154 family)